MCGFHSINIRGLEVPFANISKLWQRERNSFTRTTVPPPPDGKTKMFLNSALCLECNWQAFCGGGMELSRRFDTDHISKQWPQLPRLWLRGFIKVLTESQTLWGPAGTSRPKVQELQHTNTNFITFAHLDWFVCTANKTKESYMIFWDVSKNFS